MKIDTVAREIRKVTREKGLQVEVEQIVDLDGTNRRFWFFLNGRGQPLIGGDGQGLQDQAALEFLNGSK